MKLHKGNTTETLTVTPATLSKVISRTDLVKETFSVETSSDYAALTAKLAKTTRPFAVAIIRPS